MTQTTQQNQPKRYNVIGKVSEMTVKSLTNKPGRYVTFKLLREGKDKLYCIAFTKQAEAFLSQFKDGSNVKLFGFYENTTFKGDEGQDVTLKRFHILWSGEPQSAKPETKAEPTAEAEPENPFALDQELAA